MYHVAFLITDAFNSSNAWVHALLFDDFICSHIANYSRLKHFLSADKH